MAIKLEINQNFLEKSENDKLKLHFLPATIEGNGPANVDEYFTPYTAEENGHLTNALRGYPLKGCDFPVPANSKGIVFQETQKPLDENAERSFKVTGRFDSFTYWNYDKIPTKGDALRQAIEFIDLAQEINRPVTVDDFEMEMKKIRIKEENPTVNEKTE